MTPVACTPELLMVTAAPIVASSPTKEVAVTVLMSEMLVAVSPTILPLALMLPLTFNVVRFPVVAVTVLMLEMLVTVSPTISPLALISPLTVNDVRFPTDVKEELTTPDPSVVADRTLVPLILYVLPEVTFRFTLDLSAVFVSS